MQRHIMFRTKKRDDPTRVEMRIFKMTDHQASLLDVIADHVAENSKATKTEAMRVLENHVAQLLVGKQPNDETPKAIHDLRKAFPTLSDDDVESLPEFGCPPQVHGLILTLANIRDPNDGLRFVRFNLTQGQAEAFSRAMQHVQDINGCTRDDAWSIAAQAVNVFICGLQPKEWTPLMVELCNWFPKLSTDELMALPDATVEDMLELNFRE